MTMQAGAIASSYKDDAVITHLAHDYTNYMGTGNRAVSDVRVLETNIANGSSVLVDTVLDGNTGSNNWWTSGQSNRYVTFKFKYPVGITEITWIMAATTSQGDWKWQGSNDNSTWTDLCTAIDMGGATSIVFDLSGNTQQWTHYKLLQTSGVTNSASQYMREVEFKIDEQIIPQQYSYRNTNGTGARTGAITVTGNGTAGTLSNWVNGAIENNAYWTGGTGRWVRFDFGSGAEVRIKEARIRRSFGAANGTWKWEGSNDASTWTDISNPEVWGAIADFRFEDFIDGSVGYRYLRCSLTSGSASGSPWVYEWDFFIADLS